MDELNSHSSWRLKLARVVAPAYVAQPRVAAVAVCGSVARGWADRYSDVELAVWWDEIPTAGERAECASRVIDLSERRDFGYQVKLDAWTEEFIAFRMKFDVGHRTVRGQDHILSRVLDGYDTSAVRQQAIADVVSAIGIHGGRLLDRWQRRADPYPEGLARAMVEAHLRFGPNAWLERLAEREDVLPVAEISVTVVKRIYGVLLGLNRMYHPGYKWMDRTLASMAVCPPGLPLLMREVLDSPAGSRVAELERLIEDTIRLVEQERPEIDTAPVRARVQSSTPVRDPPPPRPDSE